MHINLAKSTTLREAALRISVTSLHNILESSAWEVLRKGRSWLDFEAFGWRFRQRDVLIVNLSPPPNFSWELWGHGRDDFNNLNFSLRSHTKKMLSFFNSSTSDILENIEILRNSVQGLRPSKLRTEKSLCTWARRQPGRQQAPQCLQHSRKTHWNDK